MKTVVKFFENDDYKKSNGNLIASATCGKVMVVDNSWLDDHPNEFSNLSNNFWEVDIIREVWPGYQKGCFICKPIKQIDSKPVCLMANSFEASYYNGILVVVPKLEMLKTNERNLYVEINKLSAKLNKCNDNDERESLTSQLGNKINEYNKIRYYWMLPVNLKRKWKETFKNIYATIVASEYRENFDYIDFVDVDTLLPNLKKFTHVNESLSSILNSKD